MKRRCHISQIVREMPAEAPVSSGIPAAVILCGGEGAVAAGGNLAGSMARVGSQPVVWHVMKTFAAFGVRRFVLSVQQQTNALGEYFLNELAEDDWQVTIVDSGGKTSPAARVTHAARYLHREDEHCFVARDNALANIDITSLYEQHIQKNKPLTVSVVRAAAHLGLQQSAGESLPDEHRGKVNHLTPGGCMVVKRGFIQQGLESCDPLIFEQQCNADAVASSDIATYYHTGFWHRAATQEDWQWLTQVWSCGEAPWTDSWPIPSAYDDAATKVA